MEIIRKGSRGRVIRFLQVTLNTHLVRLPKLNVDGVFGAKTEVAVQNFQKYAGLGVNGTVDSTTWKTLLAPVKLPANNVRKFAAQLGTVSDFVGHLQQLELTYRKTPALMESISEFNTTSSGERYLLISRNPMVIDFRHFFAAASEAYGGTSSRNRGLPIGGSRGDTLLLGVGNELAQCVGEGMKSKLNSCFSIEDLGSNRLGAEFGRAVTIAQSEASRRPVHQQLQRFLSKVDPLPPKDIGTIQIPGHTHTAAETLGAIVTGIIEKLFPAAY